ncbi:Diphthine methyltransferase homolog [Linum perenne]
MCLWLDWNPSATAISVGLSDGSVSVVSISESQLDVVQEWQAHDFEVWAASFDIHQPHLVYTGSDDCKFSCWDIRDQPSNMVFQNSKVHKMGVCCISKSPGNPNTLLTGSYDEYLRLWDVRSISKPVNQVSACLGGGVWRLKHHPFLPDVIIAACMHNGFAIVKINEEGVEVLETYDKHESLAYGADWQRGGFHEEDSEKRAAVATCSFYDKLLRAWIPQNTTLVYRTGSATH